MFFTSFIYDPGEISVKNIYIKLPAPSMFFKNEPPFRAETESPQIFGMAEWASHLNLSI